MDDSSWGKALHVLTPKRAILLLPFGWSRWPSATLDDNEDKQLEDRAAFLFHTVAEVLNSQGDYPSISINMVNYFILFYWSTDFFCHNITMFKDVAATVSVGMLRHFQHDIALHLYPSALPVRAASIENNIHTFNSPPPRELIAAQIPLKACVCHAEPCCNLPKAHIPFPVPPMDFLRDFFCGFWT